jgi:peptide deformylase
MAVRTIITGANHPILRKKADLVVVFGKPLKKLIQDLCDTAETAKGAGLAAPQIEVSEAVTVARLSGTLVPLVNPEILWRSGKILIAEEGCLSLPDIWLHIPRDATIVIRFQDEKGREQERRLDGWDARVAQHEIDHLNGKLIVDYQENDHYVGADRSEGEVL